MTSTDGNTPVPTFIWFSARGTMVQELTSVLDKYTNLVKTHLETGKGTYEDPIFFSFRESEVHDWLDFVRTQDRTKLKLLHVAFLHRVTSTTTVSPPQETKAGDHKSDNEKLLTQAILDANHMKSGNGTYVYSLKLPTSITSLPYSAQKKLAGNFDVKALQLKDETGQLIAYSTHYLDIKQQLLHLKPPHSH